MKEVILVDKNDNPTGVMEKMEAHRQGLLHRAFSIFIFNDRGEVLMQQRADDKYHNGGLWTNTCCSHPSPGEDLYKSAIRRLNEEMGFYTPITRVFDFTYKASFENGLTEHEFDHVFVGYYDGAVKADPREVKAVAYHKVESVIANLKLSPEKYTAWFRIAFPMVCEFLKVNR